MKKSLVSVSVIVALGVVWTGSAWYTGKQLEERMAEIIADANAEINNAAPESGLTLSYQDYHRGIFHSRMQLVLKPTPGAQNPFMEADQSVVFDETIDHGPFPLAQLKKFNLIPSMASIHTKLVNNSTTKPLFDITQGKSFIDAQTRVGYSGASSSDIDLLALNYEKGEEKVAFSGGQLTADVDDEGNKITLSGEAKSGVIDTVNQHGQHVQMTFNGLKSEGSTERSIFDERLGKQKFSIEKTSVAVEGKEMAVLDGLTISAKSEVQDDKKHMSGQIDYTIDALKVQNKNMGSGKLAVKVSNIDGAGMHEFSQKYNAESQKLLADPAVIQDPEVYQHNVIEVLVANLPLLLKGDPVITIAPLSWKNAKGESTFNLSLFLKDPAKAASEAMTLEQQIDSVVKSMDSKLVIPMDMATEVMTQVAQLEGYNEEDAAKLASQQIKGLAAMGQMFRVTTTQDNNIVSSLDYASGQATFNGQKMSLSDLVGMFSLSGFGIAPPSPGVPAQAVPEQ